MTREKILGWLGALALHAILAAGLMAWTVTPSGSGAEDQPVQGAQSKAQLSDGASAAGPQNDGASAPAEPEASEGDRTTPAGDGTADDETGEGGVAAAVAERDVIFWLEWEGGPDRKRVWAALPPFAPATEAGTRVRLRATVRPDGSVSGVAIAAGGSDEAFGTASAEILRRWRFTPLSSRRAQRNQTCTVTFKVVAR